MKKNDMVEGDIQNPSSPVEYNFLLLYVKSQYQSEDKIDFEKLLAIDQRNRIPALAMEFGYTRMINLIKLMSKEFIYAMPLTGEKLFTDKALELYAYEIYLASCIDFLSLEDLVLFFENTKTGKFGPITNLSVSILSGKLTHYLQLRHQAYVIYQERIQLLQKNTGPLERISPEPTSLEYLLEDLNLVQSLLKKVS